MPAKNRFFRLVQSLVALVLIFSGAAWAQSTNIEFPTPVTSGEITGKINARDLGDPRLTSHYYVFEGAQGDIFIRVETANFDGDVDVFNAQGLRPMTKMSFISGTSLTSSVREIYLRKSERMILRVEGRSANDEAATYRIRFEGSFRPSAEIVAEIPDLPEVKTESEGAVRVNSVGTIIVKKEPEEETSRAETNENPAAEDAPQKQTPPEKTPEESSEAVAENEAKTPEEKPAAATTPRGRPGTRARSGRATTPPANRRRAATAPKNAVPDPLANVRLIVVTKDGETIEHPINQVQRFAVERGILTIILKDGSILRRAVKDIARMTVE